MTAAHDSVDLVREFRRHLPPGVFNDLNDTQRVVALIYTLVTNDGWTPQQLAKRAGRNLAGVTSPGGVLTHRLEQLVGQPPEHHPREPKRVHRPGCDGFIYTTPTDPSEPISFTKCHGCLQPEGAAR